MLPDKQGRTCLHIAVIKKCKDLVKYLISKCSCDPNVADKNGQTPSEIARSKGFLDIAAYFLKIETKEDNKSGNPIEKKVSRSPRKISATDV